MSQDAPSRREHSNHDRRLLVNGPPRNSPRSVPDSHATLRRSQTRFDSWRGHSFDRSSRVCRAHGGLRSRRAGFDSRAGDWGEITSSECDGFAYDSAKVEDQVQFLAGTSLSLTLEPDGKATGCNPVQVGSTPTGVSASIARRKGKVLVFDLPRLRRQT